MTSLQRTWRQLIGDALGELQVLSVEDRETPERLPYYDVAARRLQDVLSQWAVSRFTPGPQRLDLFDIVAPVPSLLLIGPGQDIETSEAPTQLTYVGYCPPESPDEEYPLGPTDAEGLAREHGYRPTVYSYERLAASAGELRVNAGWEIGSRLRIIARFPFVLVGEPTETVPIPSSFWLPLTKELAKSLAVQFGVTGDRVRQLAIEESTSKEEVEKQNHHPLPALLPPSGLRAISRASESLNSRGSHSYSRRAR